MLPSTQIISLLFTYICIINIHATLECPVGSSPVGGVNADIPGCGLESAGSCDGRYGISVRDCLLKCNNYVECKGFSWARQGGDRNHPDQPVCTLYNSNQPTSTWGPDQIFCVPPEKQNVYRWYTFAQRIDAPCCGYKHYSTYEVSSEHFYTTNSNEHPWPPPEGKSTESGLKQTSNSVSSSLRYYTYTSEGVVFRVLRNQEHGSFPLYQYYTPKTDTVCSTCLQTYYNDHLYTIDEDEIGAIVGMGGIGNHGYRYEGILGYCYPGREDGTVPLYRLSLAANHFYTINEAEKNNHISFFERTECYVYPVGTVGNAKHDVSRFDSVEEPVWNKKVSHLGMYKAVWIFVSIVCVAILVNIICYVIYFCKNGCKNKYKVVSMESSDHYAK